MAQPPVFAITEGGTQTLCNATFVDGGFSSDYSANENEVITFCPGIPGAVVQVAFISFDLGPGDQLIIYDGPSTAAPVIVSGTGTSLAGLADSSSTGCLTFEFISDGVGEGPGWQAQILCNQPCDEPFGVIAPLAADPFKICPGDAVLLDAGPSTAAAGYTITTYDWDFGDGTTGSGAVENHVFAQPGQYNVTLQITDDIGCYSVNYAYVTVRAGTIPDLSGTIAQPGVVCVGETAQLTGVVVGTEWTNVPEPFVDGLVVLPDGNGVSYNASVEVSGFPGNTIISTATDLQQICFTMEHSYIGDLDVQLTCPTGQTVTLFNEYDLGTGPGNTFLGDPIDPGVGVPGTGFTYCFGDLATWGPFSAENAAGNYVPSTVTPGYNSMTPGLYQPETSFAALIGCPLSGFWSIEVTDNLGADDGFIFDWGLTIEPSLYPDLIVYTPVYGADCDSTFWTGPNITATDAGCDVITVTPTTPGPLTFNYRVIDDFGCEYDTTLTLTVTPAAIVDATSTLPTDCGDPVQLSAQLQAPIPGGPVIYQWTPGAGLNNATIASPQATPATPTWYVINTYPAGHPACGSADSVLVNPLTELENDSVVVDAICFADGTGGITVITTGNGGPWNYTWTDELGNVVQSTNGANGDVLNGSGGTYQVLVEEGLNGNGCRDSLLAFINEPPPVELLSLSDDTLICRTGTAILTATAQGGSGQLTFHWSNGASGSSIAVSPTLLTDYAVWATDPNQCGSDTLDVSVDVRTLMDFDLVDSIISCPGVQVVFAADSAQGGDSTFTYNWGQGFQPSNQLAVVAETSMQQCVILSDGCETPDVTRCLWLEVLGIPELIVTADSVLGCDPFFTRFHIEDTTGAALVQWDFGGGDLIPGPATNAGHTFNHPGTYDIRTVVQWPNGCYDTTRVVDMITAEPVPDAHFSWTPRPVSVLEPLTTFLDLSGPFATSWIWDFAGMDTSHALVPQFVFPSNVGGTYPVQLIVGNYLGCLDSLTLQVDVEDEFLVFIPNAITPDGDGINDRLLVQGDDIDTDGFSFTLFDRWGGVVFETLDRSIGWDGTLNGALVKEGIYAWRLTARSAYTTQPYEMLGHVTVLY